jgi:hypothetical protein
MAIFNSYVSLLEGITKKYVDPKTVDKS